MSAVPPRPSTADVANDQPAIDQAALAAARALVEQEEGATHKLNGWRAVLVSTLAIAMALVHLYAAYSVVPAQVLRTVHVGMVLVLIFLLYPFSAKFRHRILWADWAIAASALGITVYLLIGGEALADRAVFPERIDVFIGIALLVLIFEATRRTSGAIMLVVLFLFLAYAFAGPWLPAPWTHRGYELDRLIGHLVMTLEGIFGPAVDVSSSLIVLFTLFGAFLQHSGAGRFFIDFAFSLMGRSATAPGRTVVFGSFLLGAASGSGVANTVTVGSVAYPVLAKAGYGREAAGGLLAAGGLGAIIAPPVMGAAAFLIAEFLQVSYFQVVKMAIVPACLYYLSLLLMVQFDARRFQLRAGAIGNTSTATQLLRTQGFHFLSLLSIIAFLLMGFSPMMAVFWAIVVTFAASFLQRQSALTPRRLAQALESGVTGVLGVACTCAAAGVIVGVVTLTGLGLKFSSIVIQYSGGSLVLTALFTGLIVWVVGLAVPVTASYIICAVVAGPALVEVGVPEYAAHMFIFYYAVLSEVSPPTALSPFAAAAITGADPYRTTLQAWKYTLPAFVLPFAFILTSAGSALLLKGTLLEAVWVIPAAAFGIVAVAAGAQGWLLRRTLLWERTTLIVAGAALLYPVPISVVAGALLLSVIAFVQRLTVAKL